jgi:hypothetical protein
MSKQDLRESLAKELEPMFEEKVEVAEPETVEVEEVENEEVEQVEVEETEEVAEEEKNNDSNEQSLLDLDRVLSGHAKEFKELVKSISDPELQKKAIEAGKILRAREDKVASELGEVKKQNLSMANFKQMLDSDPKNTILQIAKMANIDLKNLVEPIAVEDDEYLLPEERALKEEMKSIKQELKIERQRREAQERQVIDQEINSFVSNKDQYPYFEDVYESVVELLAIEKNRNGAPLTSQERVSRIEKAYKKAVLLDDNLLEKRDAELVAKMENKRKADVEKVKTLKKVTVRSANSPTEPLNPKLAATRELERLGLV